jgi:hypothetical protein
MAITYQLYISSVTKKLEYAGLNNVIIKASFGVSAQTSAEEPASFSYSCSGYKELSVDGIDPETFINFDEVTAETVVGWLLQSEGVESVEEFSYVKAAVNHINAKLAEVQVQVEAPLIGESSVFGSVDYTPPVTPEPEPTPEELA